MKQALPAFASAWLPHWPVRPACKSVRVSLCERYTREGLVRQGKVACGSEQI